MGKKIEEEVGRENERKQEKWALGDIILEKYHKVARDLKERKRKTRH